MFQKRYQTLNKKPVLMALFIILISLPTYAQPHQTIETDKCSIIPQPKRSNPLEFIHEFPKPVNADEHRIKVVPPEDAMIQDYIHYINQKVMQKWGNHKTGLNCIVLFRINSDGSISNLRISRSSKNSKDDKYILAVIQNASPFKAPPYDACPNCEVQFTFDQTWFNNLDRQGSLNNQN